jgi:site-specific DNA recombinase
MNKSKTIKYFVYVRKSTEGEERQALSISSQTDKAQEFFGNLNIVEILEEKHSAFKPYNRPVFENMIKRIRKGEAEGIIAWHPDRLSRNEIDASTITYLVRTDIIKDLKFGSYNFDNSPEGIMMLQLSLSQSQYFSSKLGKDVKRGLEKRFNMGWHPNVCPNGYINVKNKETGLSEIEIDKERFKLIKKAFKLMIGDFYSVPQILDKLNNEWGFEPKRKKDRISGKLSRSSLYRIFTNHFYAGIIEYGGKQKQGKHKPMITLEEYDKIQSLLGKKGKPRMRKNNFAYSGLIHCAYCGSLITADKKTKIIKFTGKEKTFVYYRCNRKRPNINCQEKAVSLPDLENQIEKELIKYEFEPKFKSLLFKIINEAEDENPKQEKEIINNIENKIEQIKIEKNNLTKLSCRGLIPDNEFTEQRNDYEKQINILIQKISQTKNQDLDKGDKLEDIKFATRAIVKFRKGGEKDKKDVVMRLGSNHELSDKKLLFKAKKWLIESEKTLKPIEAKFFTLELGKNPITKAKSKALTLLCSEVRGRRDSNPRPSA